MKRAYCFYLEDDLVLKIREIAKQTKRSESFIIQEILEKHLKEKKDG